jgi:hypothetical protein
MRSTRAAFCLPFLGAVFSLAGCRNDSMAELTGTIKVNGQPLEKGSIAFAPVSGKGQTAGGEVTNGNYSVRVGIGVMKVEIRYPIIAGKKKDYDAPGGKYYNLYDESLPPKYNNESELTVDVKSGKNQKDFDLSRK